MTRAPDPDDPRPPRPRSGLRRRPRAAVHTLSPRAAFRTTPSRAAQNRAVDAVTSFSGSLPFVYVHVVWFAVWVVLNSGLLGGRAVFDRFPFGLLTLVVSLEAIFLSTFVLISQNRQTERGRVQIRLDYEADVRAEVWSVHIGAALGLDADEVEADVQHALDVNRQAIDEQADAPARPPTP